MLAVSRRKLTNACKLIVRVNIRNLHPSKYAVCK